MDFYRRHSGMVVRCNFGLGVRLHEGVSEPD